jgi:ATP-dependent Clp endopeptidase proteolytic subunit ClpP
MNLIQTENKAGKVKLTDAIMPWSVEKLTEDIGKLFGAKAAAEGADFGAITNCAENAVDTLEIEINSPGGSIFDGYNIYQEIMSLRERGVVVTATVTGMAASMASVICMACDVVRMVPHARMMIHEASQGVRGNAEELRKAADLLDGLSADIAQTYANRTGKPLDDIRALMKAETWMNAKQAVELGFANEIFDIRGAKPKAEAMSILSKLFPGNDEVSKLEASITENDSLRNDLADAQAKIAEFTSLSEANAALQIELSDLAEAKVTLETALATAAAELAAKDLEIEAAKASAGQLATQTLASIGQPEPLAINGDETPGANAITRAAFNALEHIARNSFVAGGGKITD